MANEKRLIDANAFKGKLIRELNKTGKYTPYECGLDDAISYLDNAPTVDATEVVRCKDCKHRVDDTDFVCGHFCTKRPSAGGYFCEDNDFCYYGERKDDGTAQV